jgi:hypothetical protein
MDDEGQFESEEEEIKACHELLDKHRVEDTHIVNGEDLSLYGRIALLTGDLDFGNGKLTGCPECKHIYEIAGVTEPIGKL